MKKPFIILFPLLVVGLVAAFYLFRQPQIIQQSPEKAKQSETPLSQIDNALITNEASTVEKAPIVGRRTYDTGIKNDRRVQTTKGGKRRLTEGAIIAEKLHSPETSVEEDLETIDQLLSLYRLSFERNPVAGDNQMVMEALTGQNPQDLIVLPNDHPGLDASGQLLDRWDTPYFFHALSGTEMEIFSAGPDKTFNTSDDVQFTSRDGNPLTGKVAEPDELEPPL